MKRRGLIPPTERVVEIYREMLWYRRQLYNDADFFKVPEAWEKICEGNQTYKTKTYRSEITEDFKRRAGIVVLGESATLIADEKLIERAREGCKLSNFILAHEIGHLALDHHARNAKVKNFQLFEGANGLSNIPPTTEEWEANFAAVSFQCGVALEDTKATALELAHRAYSDTKTIRMAQKLVQLDAFQRELRRQSLRYERVVL